MNHEEEEKYISVCRPSHKEDLIARSCTREITTNNILPYLQVFNQSRIGVVYEVLPCFYVDRTSFYVDCPVRYQHEV